jgi:16S rRNA C967 or C1407 C5-methylase (RsmB/RsmF family)
MVYVKGKKPKINISMNELFIARDIVKEIVLQKLSFTDAVRTIVGRQGTEGIPLSLVRSLASCELHHHLLLEHYIKNHFPNLSIDDQLLLQIFVGNQVFIKRIPPETVASFMTKFLSNIGIDATKIEQFLSITKPGVSLIHPSIKEGTSPYLSLKFNTPEWLVTMWIKHYGLSTTLKILASNNKPVIQACRINNRRTTVGALLSQHTQFIKGPVKDTVIYQGKEPLKNHPAFKEGLVFQQRLAVSDIIAQFNFENVHGEILVVETRPQALYLELPLFTNDRILINVVTNAIDRKLSMQKALQNFQFQRVSLFEGEPSQLITFISKKQDVVMVIPQCSKFDLIRSLPDFFVHFKQEDLDPLIVHQKLALNEGASFVEAGGLLFYSVNTLNHKEGKYLVAEFLEKNEAFTLISEFQYFPYDALNTALYVAALRKSKP